eukprot:2690261-Rhodomonas_salina.2
MRTHDEAQGGQQKEEAAHQQSRRPRGKRVDVEAILKHYRLCRPIEFFEVEANTNVKEVSALLHLLFLLPSILLTWSVSQEVTTLDECTICLDELSPGQFTTTVRCGHEFHAECMRHWMAAKLSKDAATKCPNCNLNIITPIIKPPSRGIIRLHAKFFDLSLARAWALIHLLLTDHHERHDLVDREQDVSSRF